MTSATPRRGHFAEAVDFHDVRHYADRGGQSHERQHHDGEHSEGPERRHLPVALAAREVSERVGELVPRGDEPRVLGHPLDAGPHLS